MFVFHLYFGQSLPTLQRGLSATADLLASVMVGFTTAADRQSIYAFIRRGIRICAGFCDENMPAMSDRLCIDNPRVR